MELFLVIFIFYINYFLTYKLLYIINDKGKIFNKEEEELIKYLKDNGLKQKDNSYDYLLNMDMDDVNCTTDIVDTFHNIFDFDEQIWDIQAIHQKVKYYIFLRLTTFYSIVHD